jgi:tRNA threonylcarbamoyladenosine biosynthesis protein TsaB
VHVLALETSGFSGSVAAADGDRLLAEITLGPRQRTGQALAPAMRDLLSQVHWEPKDVELVAVTQGPGSFTGLRVGITTAKGFAYAASAQILGVDTLEVLASQVPVEYPSLDVVMNAEREQLFAARFEPDDSHNNRSWRMVVPTRIIDRVIWIESIGPKVAVTGPALESVAELLPHDVPRVSASLWQPQAAAVARIAWRDYQAGRRDDVWKLLPNYYRDSAAEEKLTRSSVIARDAQQ